MDEPGYLSSDAVKLLLAVKEGEKDYLRRQNEVLERRNKYLEERLAYYESVATPIEAV